MKRKVSDERLREIVRRRLTKGAAFRGGSHDEYEKLISSVADKLDKMSREEIFKTYPYCTFDLK